MALTQADRIAISKKIVDIPKEDATSLDNKAKLGEALSKAQAQDNANKSLFDDQNVLVNAYQTEIKRLDGNDRTTIVEQDMINSAQQKFQNFFNPNDPATSLPSIPDGVWKNFVPFAGSKGIGKKYNETYDTIQKEQDVIDPITAAITVMEGFSDIQRSTGQSCNGSGTCSIPIHLTQSACTSNGGVWTPGPDVISNDSAVQNAATTIINAVQAWKSFLQATLAIVYTSDSNATRQAQNNISIADINNAIVVIDAWLALPTFNTSHGQTTCAGFNSYNVNLLGAVKFRAAELNTIKTEITDRVAYNTVRIGQLNTNLGGVTQNASGVITAATGLYGVRFNIINLRLNLMNGSMRKVEGIKLGQKAQDEGIASNASAASVYSSVMTCSPFRAPAQGNEFVHVKNATGFSMGDSVYVVTDTQAEIATTILAVNGNMITLATNIPEKYRQNENARIYKIL
jgi:hypothetical protein